jgi:hypothetical protein
VIPARRVQVPVRERQILPPVVVGEVVPARADVVADPSLDRLIHRGHLARGQAVGSQEPVDRVGTEGGQELALRVGPAVLDRARDVERPRGDEGQQLVLIDRQLGLAVRETSEVGAEPVREALRYRGHRLAVDPLAERRAAAARLVGDHHREARILGPGPERRLAQPRVAQ